MFVKLCGLRRIEDVRIARELAVSAIGINLVARARRAVEVDQAFALSQVARDVRVFFVIDAHPPAAIFRLLKETPHSFAQRTDPSWPWPERVPLEQRVDVVRLRQPEDVVAAAALVARVVISDAVTGLGGTGHRADWALTAALAARRETVLAGGLTPENVGEAIRAVRPFGVDVASGIEEQGQVSEARMRAFVAAARGAV